MEYTYVAYSEDNKIINGSVIANTERAASERLSKQGYRVLSLKSNSALTMDLSKLFHSKSQVKTDIIVTFCRQMATLMKAGVNVVTAIELLQAQTINTTLKATLGTVLADVRSGEKLSASMSKHPNVFPSLFCRSLMVGEQSGDLNKSLLQTAEYLEKGLSAKKSLKSALAYPFFMAIVSIAVVCILVSFVFPTFIGLYESMNVELPLVTRILLSIVNMMKAAGPYLLGIITAAVIGTMIYIRKPTGRYKWDSLMLKLPMLGYIILLRELSSCCRTMSLLFHTGLPLADIMDVLVDSAGNKVVATGLSDVKSAVFKGEGLSVPMSKNPIFLPMMVEMVKVGEETGEMDNTLLAVAQSYDSEADSRTKAFIGVLQPAVTLVIGVVVFFIVLSMMSLMYSIYGQVQL